MSDPKADLVIKWIADGNIRVQFDARRDDVRVPPHVREEMNCAFDIGFYMAIPIRDLKVDQEGISGTLSFGAYGKFLCVVPWAAVFCVVDFENDRVEVWLNDAPEEIQREVLRRAGIEANKKLRRSHLKVVK